VCGLLVGCGGSAKPAPAPSFGGAALLTLESDSGSLEVTVRSSPQPAARGEDAFQFTLTDASGKPISGLALSVQPWMPAMGHGSSVTPDVQESQPGTYLVTNVILSMPGSWQLRTSVQGSVKDSFAPTFEIP
jgi:hypothetical protein